MVNKDIGLIEYPKKVDMANCITHALGAALSAVALVMLVVKAEGLRADVSAWVFGLSLVAVYTVSAVYHGLTDPQKKLTARLIDHSTVPMLIAGTATPCALITLYEISVFHALAVFFLGWFSALFGLFAKLFFFEKTRRLTVAVYIVSSFLMMCSAIPLLGEIDGGAFGELVFGNALYLAGAFFCWLGKKRPAMHAVFHIFALLASAVHFFVIYRFVL
ncbi:MAG: hemolysin III family protein [Clostridia bacterium]|nr:hemolysin III family protein [Clostridia bacterium]